MKSEKEYKNKENTIEQFGIFEAEIAFEAVNDFHRNKKITGIFTSENERKEIKGFYDGNNVWKIRFMPSFSGLYKYSLSDENGWIYEDSFLVNSAGQKNHGPVRVANTFHFAYEDGTGFYPVGTTCYVWNLQEDGLIEQTLEQLKESGFNKIRFCIFPKHYDYNLGEPSSYPFIGTSMDSSVLTPENFMEYGPDSKGNDFDYDSINPEHFRKIDQLLFKLQDLGIEADMILFHPYDRWGFSIMSPEQDKRYLEYVINRYAAFRNVWWALANEYDLLNKPLSHWEDLADILVRKDPYHHLRSIHNCRPFYDHTRAWITHASIQRQDLYRTSEFTDEWRIRFGKPVVLDELGYEGNLQHGWGNISGKELTRRAWEALCRGGYAQHGETLLNPTGKLWWSHGGKLYGKSWKRFKFLHSILELVPGNGLSPNPLSNWDEISAIPESEFMLPVKSFYLYYYGFERPSFRDFFIDENTPFRVIVVDTWKMKMTDAGIHSGKFRINLPSKSYMAVILLKI